MMLECGSACRLPFSPAARSREPIEHACPIQYVCMGDDTYCIYVCVGQVRTETRAYSDTHCVIDCETGGHATAGRVDVHMNGLGRLLGLQEQ